MSKSRHGKIDGQFTPLLWSTMDTPAWKQVSHGAKCLYIELRRRVPRERNQSYLSNRLAARELRADRQKVREWFAELEHYGFIVLAVPGCLGVEGKGRAPHWRLTELGSTPRASADGLPDLPSRDFLKWDGVLFDPTPFRKPSKLHTLKTESRSGRPYQGGRDAPTTPGCTSHPPISQSGRDAPAIEQAGGGRDAPAISSLTTTSESPGCSPTLSPALSEGSSDSEAKVGPSERYVVVFDERIEMMKQTERRLRREARERRAQ